MAETRAGYAGTASAGDVYTADNHARMPGGWLGFGERTTDFSGTENSEVDITGLSFTITPPNNRLLKISFFGIVAGGTDDGEIRIGLYEDAVELQRLDAEHPADAGTFVLVTGFALHESDGSQHTYKATFEAFFQSPRIECSASTAYLLVEDIGPAPAA